MEIVKDFEFGNRGRQSKYYALFKQFRELEPGTAVKFVKGADFDGEPERFSVTLRQSMYGNGLRVKIAVREDAVYAVIVGTTTDGKQDEEAEQNNVRRPTLRTGRRTGS